MKPVPVTLLVAEYHRPTIYPPALVAEIEAAGGAPARWVEPAKGAGGVPADTEAIFSTWGMPRMDAAFLDALPALRAVFYAAGSVRGFVTPAVYERGIIVCAAAAANAVPVAEYTVATIILSLKQTWQTMRQVHARKINRRSVDLLAGSFGSRVGLVSLGLIGRRVAAMLKSGYDLDVVAYDPFVSQAEAEELGVRLVSLEEAFRTSEVVSLHTPILPATRGMFRREHFEAMKANATLVNTARGGLIREADLYEVLAARPDLTAVLDVTDPEPPVAGSPLYDLPNVFLTPHIAGSVGDECRRMTRYMIDEFRRWQSGAPLQYRVSARDLERMA